MGFKFTQMPPLKGRFFGKREDKMDYFKNIFLKNPIAFSETNHKLPDNQ